MLPPGLLILEDSEYCANHVCVVFLDKLDGVIECVMLGAYLYPIAFYLVERTTVLVGKLHYLVGGEVFESDC